MVKLRTQPWFSIRYIYLEPHSCLVRSCARLIDSRIEPVLGASDGRGGEPDNRRGSVRSQSTRVRFGQFEEASIDDGGQVSECGEVEEGWRVHAGPISVKDERGGFPPHSLYARSDP